MPTQAAHTGAMDMHDLENLRKFSDSFNLLNQMFKRYSKCVFCKSKKLKKLKIQSFRENFIKL